MDFIVKLLPSKELLTGVIYNSILVIVDRLTKFVYFVLYLEASTAEQLVDTILRIVVVQYGMLEEFLTDRDKLFTSTFWQLLMNLMGVYYKMLTSYYL